MVWLVGIAGFVIGFIGGIYMLKRWLKDRSNEELVTDKSLHHTYGVFVWMVAAVTSAAAIWIYKIYF